MRPRFTFIQMALYLLVMSFLGSCATLRLNGCARLAVCGALTAYSCEDELVCADKDGQIINAEQIGWSHVPCSICR